MLLDLLLTAAALFATALAIRLLRRPAVPVPVPDDLAQQLATIKVTLDIHGKALRDLVETSDHQGEALRELIECNVDEIDETRRRLAALECCKQHV